MKCTGEGKSEKELGEALEALLHFCIDKEQNALVTISLCRG